MADRTEFSPGDIGFLKADETGLILRELQACQEIKKFWAETREEHRQQTQELAAYGVGRLNVGREDYEQKLGWPPRRLCGDNGGELPYSQAES